MAALGLECISLLCAADALEFFAAWRVVARQLPSLPYGTLLAPQWVRLDPDHHCAHVCCATMPGCSHCAVAWSAMSWQLLWRVSCMGVTRVSCWTLRAAAGYARLSDAACSGLSCIIWTQIWLLLYWKTVRTWDAHHLDATWTWWSRTVLLQQHHMSCKLSCQEACLQVTVVPGLQVL